jgi:chaperonin GroES
MEVKEEIRPLQDRVHRGAFGGEEKTKGGYHHPRHREGETHGRQGDRRWGKGRPQKKATAQAGCQAGDVILFSKYAGTEVKIDGKEYLIMREDDILGIVEK